MAGNKNTLERKLQAENEPKSKVSMETNLRDFGEILYRDFHRTGKKKGNAFHLAVCMVGHLSSGKLPGTYLSLKEIHGKELYTVGDLYSFTEKELLGFSHYRGKTWMKLNECLAEYGLPPVKLPQEWIQQP